MNWWLKDDEEEEEEDDNGSDYSCRYCAMFIYYLIKSSQQSIKISFTHILQRK